ncbi:MAG: hypothetical protein ACLT3D_03345 [Lawsonibacter sp.]
MLGCKQSGEGYLEGEKYIVTWALGHLVELAPPEDYDKAWAKWDMLTLPMLPERMKTVVEDPPVRPAVPGGPGPSCAGGTWASWSSPPTRAGRELVRCSEGRVEGAGQAAVDLPPQTDKAIRWLRLPAARSGVRPVPPARACSEADWLRASTSPGP